LQRVCRVSSGRSRPFLTSREAAADGVTLWPSPAGAARGSAQRSQIDIGKCCARKKFPPTVETGFVSVSLSDARDECRGGKSSGASDVPLGSRVRLPNSAARHLAGNVPGEAEAGEPVDLSRVKSERVPGAEALTAV